MSVAFPGTVDALILVQLLFRPLRDRLLVLCACRWMKRRLHNDWDKLIRYLNHGPIAIEVGVLCVSQVSESGLVKQHCRFLIAYIQIRSIHNYMSLSRNKYDMPLLAFKSVLVLIIFLVGGVFAHKHWQPFKFLVEGYQASNTLIKEQMQVRPELLRRHRYGGDGVTIYNPDKAYSGVTALQGLLPGGAQIRLVDMSGNEIHRWLINYFEIWPNPTHLEEKYQPKSDFNYHTHGMVIFPDGSIVFNVSNIGAAKLSKCGKVEWTLDRATHHSITLTEDGSFWIPGNRAIRNIPEYLMFPGVTRELLESDPEAEFNRYENIILLVDEYGEVQREISVLQSLYDGGFESQIFDMMQIEPTDPTHINDIEVVTQELADKVPGVSKGDILVSIRQMHMLAFFDPVTGVIKKHFVGPWVRQHDPDISPNGNLVVFNNGRKGFHFNRIEGSNLVEFDPETGNTHIIYPIEGQQSFYTEIVGNHQLLGNGNRLIAESLAGRVIEVTHQGEIVWEYVIPYDETHASLIETAQRLDSDYFTFENWNCE